MTKLTDKQFEEMKSNFKVVSDRSFLDFIKKNSEAQPDHKEFFQALEKSDVFKAMYFDGFTLGMDFGKSMFSEVEK